MQFPLKNPHDQAFLFKFLETRHTAVSDLTSLSPFLPSLFTIPLFSPQNVQRCRWPSSGCSCSMTSALSSHSLQLLLVRSAPLCGSHLQRRRRQLMDEVRPYKYRKVSLCEENNAVSNPLTEALESCQNSYQKQCRCHHEVRLSDDC